MTLIYFNVKYFMLKTLEEHKKLSFTHIMKHYKKGGTATPVTRNTTPVHPGEKQTLLLRYYPPADRKNFNVHKNIFKIACCLSRICAKVRRIFNLLYASEMCLNLELRKLLKPLKSTVLQRGPLKCLNV